MTVNPLYIGNATLNPNKVFSFSKKTGSLDQDLYGKTLIAASKLGFFDYLLHLLRIRKWIPIAVCQDDKQKYVYMRVDALVKRKLLSEKNLKKSEKLQNKIDLANFFNSKVKKNVREQLSDAISLKNSDQFKKLLLFAYHNQLDYENCFARVTPTPNDSFSVAQYKELKEHITLMKAISTANLPLFKELYDQLQTVRGQNKADIFVHKVKEALVGLRTKAKSLSEEMFQMLEWIPLYSFTDCFRDAVNENDLRSVQKILQLAIEYNIDCRDCLKILQASDSDIPNLRDYIQWMKTLDKNEISSQQANVRLYNIFLAFQQVCEYHGKEKKDNLQETFKLSTCAEELLDAGLNTDFVVCLKEDQADLSFSLLLDSARASFKVLPPFYDNLRPIFSEWPEHVMALLTLSLQHKFQKEFERTDVEYLKGKLCEKWSISFFIDYAHKKAYLLPDFKEKTVIKIDFKDEWVCSERIPAEFLLEEAQNLVQWIPTKKTDTFNHLNCGSFFEIEEQKHAEIVQPQVLPVFLDKNIIGMAPPSPMAKRLGVRSPQKKLRDPRLGRILHDRDQLLAKRYEIVKKKPDSPLKTPTKPSSSRELFSTPVRDLDSLFNELALEKKKGLDSADPSTVTISALTALDGLEQKNVALSDEEKKNLTTFIENKFKAEAVSLHLEYCDRKDACLPRALVFNYGTKSVWILTEENSSVPAIVGGEHKITPVIKLSIDLKGNFFADDQKCQITTLDEVEDTPSSSNRDEWDEKDWLKYVKGVPGFVKAVDFLKYKNNEGKLKQIYFEKKYPENLDEFSNKYPESKNRLELRDGLTINQVLKMMYPLTVGLFFMHNNDVLHRDIKLKNIVTDGQETLFIDFGCTCTLDKCLKAVDGTYYPTLINTAPELIFFKGIARDPKAEEMFAFGKALYEGFFRSMGTYDIGLGNLFMNPDPTMKADGKSLAFDFINLLNLDLKSLSLKIDKTVEEELLFTILKTLQCDLYARPTAEEFMKEIFTLIYQVLGDDASYYGTAVPATP